MTSSPEQAGVAAQRLLQRLAGDAARLRDGQAVAIRALVDDRSRVLLVQRTGWGKSAVYWIATALRRSAGAGPTLVVSPLLALMRDQVDAARRVGLAADTVNSTNPDEWQRIGGAVDRDELDVLLISPERLNAPSFRDRLAQVAPRLGLLVVDEAHCISDWGHDFRPDYRRIRDVLNRLSAATPVLACTATANARVIVDVAAQLGAGTTTLRGPLARTSLQLAVVRLANAETRLAWLDAFVRRHRPIHGHAGVIYTLTVADTHRVARFLAGRGLAVAAYASDLQADARTAVEDALKANRLDAVVATSALGMGYDKPDLAFVVHLGAPSSPVAYYQQVGRAGRALPTAEVVLLPTGKDERIWEHFDVAGLPTRRETAALLDALDPGVPQSIPALERRVDVRRTRLELLLKILDVDGAAARVGSGWVATGRGWQFDTDRYRRLEQLRRAEHAAMRQLVEGRVEGCLMAFLAAQLDDVDPVACGRCQGCVGWTPDVTVHPEAVAAARAFLRAADVAVPARRHWPYGLDEVRGGIPPGRRPAEGRALAGGDDSGWAQTVDQLLARSAAGRFDARYDTLLSEVVDGLVAVLARWRWAARPTAIVPVPSHTHTQLVADVAAGLGQLGRLPVVGALAKGPGRRQHELANSAHKAANALARLHPAAAAQLPAGPVLLVDVAADSGWTAVAAAWRLTGAAGERDVLPLVLATARG